MTTPRGLVVLLSVLLSLVVASQLLPAGSGSDDRAEAVAHRLSGVSAVAADATAADDWRERVLFVLQGAAGLVVFGWAVRKLGRG